MWLCGIAQVTFTHVPSLGRGPEVRRDGIAANAKGFVDRVCDVVYLRRDRWLWCVGMEHVAHQRREKKRDGWAKVNKKSLDVRLALGSLSSVLCLAKLRDDVCRRLLTCVVCALFLSGLVVSIDGCGPAKDPSSLRSPGAQKWFDRAKSSFDQIDMDDAQDAIKEALRMAPRDPDVLLLAANLALAKLDYDEVVRLTDGLADTAALALRGRALWYAGDIKGAAATLESLMRDPDVRDPWAKAVSKLANQGAGRVPFEASGDVVASIEMPPVRGPAMIVPLEFDGEPGLALVSTGSAEVVLDKAHRKDPSWVSLRFDGRVEFQDVPAVTLDLSGISRMLGAPIKALLGVNFLRHANVTFDLEGRQFVVRQFPPPRPPNASDLPVFYMRGGGMVVQGSLTSNSSRAALIVDSSQMMPLVLDADGWRKAGVDPKSLTSVGGDRNLRGGEVSLVRLGAFDIAQVGAVMNSEVDVFEKGLGVQLDGIIGAGLIGAFRVTFGDSGKALWLEQEL